MNPIRIEGRPLLFHEIPSPGIVPGFLQAFEQFGGFVNSRRTEFLPRRYAFRRTDIVAVRSLAVPIPPEKMDVGAVRVADETIDVEVVSGEIGRGIEEFDEIFPTENVPEFGAVGVGRFDRLETLNSRVSRSLVERRQALARSGELFGFVGCGLLFRVEVEPMDSRIGEVRFHIDEPAVATAEPLDEGRPWGQFREQSVDGKVHSRLDYLRADDDLPGRGFAYGRQRGFAIPWPEIWPRRLVYCLPMRTLVEQTEEEVTKWIFRLALAATEDGSDERNAVAQVLSQQEPSTQSSVKEYNWNDEGSLADAFPLHSLSPLLWLTGVEATNSSFIPHNSSFSPIVLMGGEDLDPAKRDWDLHPERPAILIGTQDMLLSRALNRGYGMSRYRWPMHFGLLNNDCLWVMDEVQLMGAGLASTTQLEGFRAQEDLGSHSCRSWWMSATIRPDWMKTVDLPHELLSAEPLRLNPAEKDQRRVKALRSAPKALTVSGIASGDKNMKDITRYIADNRSASGLNLAVFNTVKRARAAHDALRKTLPKDAPVPLLLHSHFRKGVPSSRLSRRMASAARWGAWRLVIGPTSSSRSSPEKSTSITGIGQSFSRPLSIACWSASSRRLAWDCTESIKTQGIVSHVPSDFFTRRSSTA